MAARTSAWYNATGWCCYTNKGHTQGDKLTACLCETVTRILHDHKMRFDYSDGDPGQEANFAIPRGTICIICKLAS